MAADSLIPLKLITITTKVNSTHNGTVHGKSDGKAETRAATPAVMLTATVNV